MMGFDWAIQGGRGNLAGYSSPLADTILVSKGATVISGGAGSITKTVSFSSTRSSSRSSTGKQAQTSGNGIIREAFESQGISPKVAEFLLGSWRTGTKQQYGSYVKRWLSFCTNGRFNPFQPPVNILLEFLHNEFKSVKKKQYSSMNSIRSAISSIAIIDGKPAGQHVLVCRFMKAVFNLKPALPRYNVTWDPGVVLNYIRGSGPNKRLTIIQLSRKLVMLMLLQSGQRGQTLNLLDVRNMFFYISKSYFYCGRSP